MQKCGEVWEWKMKRDNDNDNENEEWRVKTLWRVISMESARLRRVGWVWGKVKGWRNKTNRKNRKEKKRKRSLKESAALLLSSLARTHQARVFEKVVCVHVEVYKPQLSDHNRFFLFSWADIRKLTRRKRACQPWTSFFLLRENKNKREKESSIQLAVSLLACSGEQLDPSLSGLSLPFSLSGTYIHTLLVSTG